ncbi:hypothetical protein [Actinomadura violacea]|uniref:Uncharacterized protein n=1 Tax=Actinomadura violacea TaxID=2819934 RepID=A0ABS3RYA8_9ACTN|nr:hypothetical protein [Actinomadura violacea]MBO2461746.1 hypothetical protein [Actinomadura violacea]
MPTFQYAVETSHDGDIWMPRDDESCGVVRSNDPDQAARDILAGLLDDVPDDDWQGHWRCVLWSELGPMPPADEAAAIATWEAPRVVWSVVRGPARGAHAVDPAVAGIEVDDMVLEWAVDSGFDANDAEMGLRVTLSDLEGPIEGEVVAWSNWPANRTEAALLTKALAATTNTNGEK